MKNTALMTFNVHGGSYGSLIALEGCREVPFEVRRIYYIYGVEQTCRRGFHSHQDLEQVLICPHGCVKILVKTPFEETVYTLDSPDKGLYIGPMIWREMFDWQDDAVLLVLASKYYDEKDYIRDYQVYQNQAISYFQSKE